MITGFDGTFTPPRGRGRLYLQGGTDRETGQVNTLLLTTPAGTRSISVLSSLFQALADRRPRRPATVRSLLNLNNRARLRDFVVVPVSQASSGTQEFLRRDAQQDLLARFLKGLSLGAGPRPTQSSTLQLALAVPLQAAAASPRRNLRGDGTIGALADALLTTGGASGPVVDIANATTVNTVLTNAANSATGLNLDVDPADLTVAAQVAADINTSINTATNDATLTRLRQISFNATKLVTAQDFDTLMAQFTGTDPGTPLQNQITGTLVQVDLPSDPTTLVSVGADGSPANGRSGAPDVNQDGRFVTFHSGATNLVDGLTDTSVFDIFVRDVATRTTRIVSIGANGEPAVGSSGNPAINADGRFIAFQSNAVNLTDPPPTGIDGDLPDAVYRRDLQRELTVAVSLDRNGRLVPGGSADINADGRYVVFSSSNSNLVANDTNQRTDVFRRDVTGRRTVLISTATTGGSANGVSSAPTLSDDGTVVVFQSDATNLVANDVNGALVDVYLRDLKTNQTVLVSQSAAGVAGDSNSTEGRVSGNGQFVVFSTPSTTLIPEVDANGLAQVYRFDRQAASAGTALRLVTSSPFNPLVPGNGSSAAPAISEDGRFVAFRSAAQNLLTTTLQTVNAQIYVRDMLTGRTELISRDSRLTTISPGNLSSAFARVSGDGRYVAFDSSASNLVTGDTNQQADVFESLIPASVIRDGLDGGG